MMLLVPLLLFARTTWGFEDDALTTEYMDMVMPKLEENVRDRLRGLLTGTTTKGCRDLVTSRFTEVYSRLLREDWMPFETEQFKSECLKESPERTLPPIDASKIRLAYLLLVHESPDQVIRLVNALTEGSRHSFAIHVDGKAASHGTHAFLEQHFANRTRVHVMESRTNVSWGGFNVVKATLFGLEAVLEHFDGDFDWIVTVSGYTYPLASNSRIRETLAQYPADTEFLEIRPKPNDPQPRAWHQYVECDNAMRRIYRYMPPKGVSMYMGSQWMIITRDFARYAVGDRDRSRARHLTTYESLASRPSDAKLAKREDWGPLQQQTFAAQYERYAQFTMVADENFFVTLMKNSPFCRKHHNDNYLHVQFDQWENEKAEGPAQNKCLQPNPRHCGRSPTTLTLEYLPVLELGGALFARKFDPKRAVDVLDALDRKRLQEASLDYKAPQPPTYKKVQLIAAARQLCAQVSDVATSKILRDVVLAPCDPQNPSQLFDLGPCSTDGAISLSTGGPANVTPGLYAPAPFCPITAAHLISDPLPTHGLCLDLEREQIVSGTNIIAYACSGRWNQLFGFGTAVNGKPQIGAVYVNIPYAHHDPKELCLEATGSSSSESVTLKVQKCDPTNLDQVFHLQYASEAPHERRIHHHDDFASPDDDVAESEL